MIFHMAIATVGIPLGLCSLGYELVLKHLDIRIRLFPDLESVYVSALRAERTAKFDDSGAAVARVADANDVAEFEKFSLILCRHLSLRMSPGRIAQDTRKLCFEYIVQGGCESIA
jgi:hypothetical protein